MSYSLLTGILVLRKFKLLTIYSVSGQRSKVESSLYLRRSVFLGPAQHDVSDPMLLQVILSQEFDVHLQLLAELDKYLLTSKPVVFPKIHFQFYKYL